MPTIRNCWLLPCGEIRLTPNWGDHIAEARKSFPDAIDPEAPAIAAGWLKVYREGDGIQFVGQKLTPQQREAIEGPLFGLIADDVEADATGNWRFWQTFGELKQKELL